MSHTRVSHVTHMSESCHTRTTCTRLSYCTDTGAMTKSLTRPLITASTNMLKSDKRGTPRVPGANLLYMSHVTRVNESCHTCERGEARLECSAPTYCKWASHVTHMNELGHTYTWVMSHVWMSHVTRMYESCLAYVTHMWTHMNGLGHTYKWVMPHVWMPHMSMRYVYVWHTYMCDICETWLIQWMRRDRGLMCDMTHSHVWHVWHDSFICVTWVIHMFDMTHSVNEP